MVLASKHSRLLIGLIGLSLGLLIQVGCQHVGFFDRYDEADADHYASTFPKENDFSTHITIVTIDDNDYREEFNSQSPLNPKALLRIVRAVQAYGPRVIGLDIVTRDWSAPLEGIVDKTGTPVVWARDGRVDLATGNELLILNGVAGYASPPPDLCSGVPLSQPDPDGKIRHYTPAITVNEAGASTATLVPTMAHVLASSFPDRPLDCRIALQQKPLRICFTCKNHTFRSLPSSVVLHDAGDRQFGEYLRNRIVIIGGTYAAARDRYLTAAGFLDGVDILGDSVESEISGPLRDLPQWLAIAINITFSFLLFLLTFRIPWPWNLGVSVTLVVGFSFVSGWALYWLGIFSPVASSLFGLPIGVIAEHCVECKVFGNADGQTKD